MTSVTSTPSAVRTSAWSRWWFRRREWVRTLWRQTVRVRHVPVALLVLGYFVWFTHLSLSVYYGFGDPPYDLGIFDQGLWLLSHFHSPFVTLMGRNFFGDHAQFIFVLLAPLYRVFPEPQGLLILQAFVLAMTAVPLFMLTQRILKSTWISTTVAAIFLLNPAVQQGNLEQFHPESLETLFICWALYAAYTKKWGWLVAMVTLILLTKEDAAALVVPLGMWVAWRRDRRWGLGIVVAGVAVALFDFLVVIPALLGRGSLYTSFLPFGGATGLLGVLVRHPAQLWSYLRADGRPYYVWQMAFSAGLTFVVAPEYWLIGAGVIGENVISNLYYMHQIQYHYSMAVVPVLLFALVAVIARQTTARRRATLVVVSAVCALWSCILWGLAPFSNSHAVPVFLPTTSAASHAVVRLEAMIPADAVVSAWYPLISHIEHRQQIYMWPNPFSTYYYGTGSGGVRLAVSDRVQYLLLPTTLDSSSFPDVFAKIAPYYVTVSSASGYTLYKRINAG